MCHSVNPVHYSQSDTTSVADPDPGSGIRDPGSGAFLTLGSGSGIGFFRIPDKHPGSATLDTLEAGISKNYWAKNSA